MTLRTATLILMACVLPTMAGCPAGRVDRRVTLHYTDSQRMFLVPVSRVITTSTKVDAALEETLATLTEPPSRDLRPALASGSHVTVHAVKGPHVELDVTLPDRGGGSGDEHFMASALVRTAATVVPLEDVRLRLLTPAGKPVTGTHLDLERAFSPTDPTFENLYEGGEDTGIAVLVYYPLRSDSLLTPVRIPLASTAGTEPVRETFVRWHDGPPEDLQAFLTGARATGTRLSWAGLHDGEATVVWQNAPEATPSAIALRSLVLTLTEYSRVQRVRLVSPSGPIQARIGPFDLGNSLERPDEVNTWPERAS
ncbi:MAG: hypothetical protein VKP72_07050 [bacterium]|nr:hypothetical protein [bacterium]